VTELSTPPFTDLLGDRWASITFVLNDYVQLHFDEATLNAYEWPIIRLGDVEWTIGDAGYRDALCERINATLATGRVVEKVSIQLEMSDGAHITIPLQSDEPGFETAEFSGESGWWVWTDDRPLDPSRLVDDSAVPAVYAVACCFCGKPVDSGDIDPVELTVGARADRVRIGGIGLQTLWCHADCLDATGMSDLHVTRPAFWDTGADGAE